MPQISIIVPVYYSEKYLTECVESILNQTFGDFELIFVDDGSKDRSVEIIKNFMENDRRIILLEQSNQYAGIARNNGMKNARGEYLIFLDSDDFFEPDMMEKLWKKANDNNADIVICDAYFYSDDTKEITEPNWVLRKEYVPNMKEVFNYRDIMQHIFQISFSVPWNKLYRKSFVESNNLLFQNTRRSNDEFFTNTSLVLAERICILNERLIKYRTDNPTSLQGGIGKIEVSYDFAFAHRAIKSELIQRNIYEDVKHSFINKCISACMSALRKQKNAYSFECIYMFLKTEFFEEMEILGWPEGFYYANYEELQRIVMYDPMEYLFNKSQAFKDGLRFIFPYKEVGDCKNIVLYAAGEMGKAYFKQIFLNEHYRIVAWVDKNYLKYKDLYVKIENPEVITKLDFDKVIIAIEDNKVKKQVTEYLISLGIEQEKVV